MVPPAPYMPPGMFSSDPVSFQPSGPVNDASSLAVTSPPQARCFCISAPHKSVEEAALVVQPKRPPNPPDAPPPATTKVDANPAHTKKRKKDQENIPPSIEVLDSDDEIEKMASGKTRHWQANKKTRLFTFILGPDEEGQRCFIQHKTNPSHVYKRASENEFKGDRSPQLVKSVFERALKTYAYMRAFDGFTGNGGGDADSDDPTAILKHKLNAARNAGIPLGALKASTIEEWESEGWRELFDLRFGTAAKVSREVVRHSAKPISDAEDEDSGDNSDAIIHPELCKPAPCVPKAPAATVLEPKHTPSSTFRKQVNNSFSNLGELMKMKMAVEEKKASAYDAKLTLEHEKFEMDKMKEKVDMAYKILSMPGASDQVKDAANAFLFSLFAS
ncbi:Histone acetyltransferase [Mycena venus]|uniref:Histone acetyltransferase n=1 Tax=Mycena venus TaxID=2733690 RepID=A0A8H6YE71_9AGAR|nr:Histone acetyltransferase [Mycena venus]